MLFNNFKQFNEYLAQEKRLPSAYLIISEDDYEIKETLNVLTRKREIKTLDGSSATISSLLGELNSHSLLSATRAVVIRKAEKLGAEKERALENYLSAPNKSVFLILTSRRLDKRMRLYKYIERDGIILNLVAGDKFALEKRLREKIVERLKADNKIIDPKTCRQFIQYTGYDQHLIFQELKKLVCHIGERRAITGEDISSLCAKTNMEDIWRLSDVIFNGNGLQAYEVAHQMIEKTPIFILLRQLRTQFQNKCKLAELIALNATEDEIQSHFPYMKGKIMQLNIQAVNRFGLKNLKEALTHIDFTESLAKNSCLEPHFLIDNLIFKLMAT